MVLHVLHSITKLWVWQLMSWRFSCLCIFIVLTRLLNIHTNGSTSQESHSELKYNTTPVDSEVQSKLIADYASVRLVKVIWAHATPLSVIENLHPTFCWWSSTDKSYGCACNAWTCNIHSCAYAAMSAKDFRIIVLSFSDRFVFPHRCKTLINPRGRFGWVQCEESSKTVSKLLISPLILNENTRNKI